jgi:hypothetical protein
VVLLLLSTKSRILLQLLRPFSLFTLPFFSSFIFYGTFFLFLCREALGYRNITLTIIMSYVANTYVSRNIYVVLMQILIGSIEDMSGISFRSTERVPTFANSEESVYTDFATEANFWLTSKMHTTFLQQACVFSYSFELLSERQPVLWTVFRIRIRIRMDPH